MSGIRDAASHAQNHFKDGVRTVPRKKLVSLNYYDIFPLINGGQKSVLGLCRGLSAYFDVTLIMFCGADVYKDEIPAGECLTIVPIPRPRDLVEREYVYAYGMGLDKPSPITADTMWAENSEMLEKVRQAAGDADILLIDHPYTYQIARNACPDKVFWHRANNVEVNYMRGELEKYPRAEEMLELIDRIERKCCQGCDYVFTVTESDRLELIDRYQLNPERVTNISVGSDFSGAAFVLPSARRNKRRQILYLSGFYHAADEAVGRILAAANELPEYNFLFAGIICSSERLRNVALPANVQLLWVVSEERKAELLRDCDLALNPVLSGAGINMKLMEYFACGISVLSTRHGIRGINAHDGTEVFLEQGPSLADDIQQVLSTADAQRDEIAIHAREMVMRDWSWETVAERMVLGGGMSVSENRRPLPRKAYPLLDDEAIDFRGKTVFMWGAGELGVFRLNELRNRGINSIRIIDKNPDKIGELFEGTEIEPVSALYQESGSYCIISVGNYVDVIDIYRELQANHVDSSRIIVARGPLLNPGYLDREKLRGTL